MQWGEFRGSEFQCSVPVQHTGVVNDEGRSGEVDLVAACAAAALTQTTPSLSDVQRNVCVQCSASFNFVQWVQWWCIGGAIGLGATLWLLARPRPRPRKLWMIRWLLL